MPSSRDLAGLEAVLHAQTSLLAEARTRATAAQTRLTCTRDHREQVAQADALVTQLEASVETLRAHDFDTLGLDELTRLLRPDPVPELARLEFTSWSEFEARCAAYNLARNGHPTGPFDVLLSDDELDALDRERTPADHRWDRWDVLAVAASGISAILVDFLLVRGPLASTVNGGRTLPQSPVTGWLRNITGPDAPVWFKKWTSELERRCNVPYDRSAFDGMSGWTHRHQTLGHDPILGMAFGVLDIYRNTITGFSYDRLTQQHRLSYQSFHGTGGVSIVEAFLRQMGHLFSDVGTNKGLPAPLLPLAQAFNLGSFGDRERTIAEISRWMYTHGYDLRHFLTMGLSPATVEITLRALIMLRHSQQHGSIKIDLASHPKYRAMLAAAHGIACLGNAGKIWTYRNPLALNLPEWYAFARYLLPSISYLLFGRTQIRIEHLQHLTETEWADLMVASRCLADHRTGILVPSGGP